MNITATTIFFTNLLAVITAYKILGLFPFPGSSHYTMFGSLMKELAEKGHEVDVLSHYPQEKPIPRFNDLSLKGTMMEMRNSLSVNMLRDMFKNRFSNLGFHTEFAGVMFCEFAFNTTAVQELKNSQKHYDLVITELFGNDCMLGFGYHFKAPVIILMSGANLPWGNDRFGNPDNPAYVSSYFAPYAGNMSLLQRLDNTLMLLLSKIWYSHAQSRNTAIVRHFFGNLPDLRELAFNNSLLLVNSHHSLTGVRPTVPNVVEVGGLHIKPAKPLPQSFQDVLNVTSKKYKGTILFSLGSMVLTETLPREKLVALFGAFAELPYQILWKASKDKIPSGIIIPTNTHFESWIPQIDVLCHPNLKLFVTHGGLLGLQEAIFCGVPCLGIPLFADQDVNVKMLESRGIGLSLNYDTFTKEDTLASVNEILNNPSYKENIEIVSQRFKDRPLSPLDTAVYWVEYVIRHKGAGHLRSPAIDLAWYQYHLLDVGVILISGLLAICYIIYKVIMKLLKTICGSHKTEKQKNN